MGRRALALDRRLRPARHVHQHFQGLDHGLLTDVVAPDGAEPLLLMGDAAVARSDSEMHQSHGLSRRRATRTCDARDCDGKIDIGMFKSAERHRDRDFLADGTKRFQLQRLDTEHLMLGLVGIGDEPAVHHIR